MGPGSKSMNCAKVRVRLTCGGVRTELRGGSTYCTFAENVLCWRGSGDGMTGSFPVRAGCCMITTHLGVGRHLLPFLF